MRGAAARGRARLTGLLVVSAAAGLLAAGCCCFSAADGAYRAHMKTAFSPGAETDSMHALDPKFRPALERVLARLRKQGWHPYVRSTYRSPRRQEAMYNMSQARELFGAGPGTHAKGGESCHNHRTDDDQPGALAADIVPGEGDKQDTRSRARFYWALGKAARAEGMVWGGSWAKTNPTWRKYGLGWDPGHVQSKRCTWKLLKRDRERFLKGGPPPQSDDDDRAAQGEDEAERY